MNNPNIITIFAAAFLLQVASASAGDKANIADSLYVRSNGRIVVNQSDGIRDMFAPDTVEVNNSHHQSELTVKEATKVVHKAGYRIQVYSDNKQRTAKANAERIASRISGMYPTTGTYLAYKAPYWRLKVGDFQTRNEAMDFMQSELKKSFPSLAGEMIIVRDRINVFE